MEQSMLSGVRVLELAGLAPVPFCGMLLADFGAEVNLVINKKSSNSLAEFGRIMAGKKNTIQLDFGEEDDRSELFRLCLNSDVLLDPYRPGTLESIGLEPTRLMQENIGLIVARITGYGQSGPMASRAGHDINYVALSGLLPTISGNGRAVPPWPPANLLADFAAGGLLAAFGVVAALHRRTQNGRRGCVLDCAMTEGLAYLGSFLYLSRDLPMLWEDKYAIFSGQCPFYRTYKTADGKWMAVGALEHKFRQNLFKKLGIDENIIENPEELVMVMERIFKMKTRKEWMELFEGEDACVTPVLEIDEAGKFWQNRKTFEQKIDGIGRRSWMPRAVPRMEENGKTDKERSKL